MAAVIPKNFLDGGSGLNRGLRVRDQSTLPQIVENLADDAANLFTITQALADKLDLDAGVTDTNYRAIIDAIATGPETTKEP